MKTPLRPRSVHLPARALLLALVLLTPLTHAVTAASADQAAALLAQNELAAADALLNPLTLPDSTDASAFFHLGRLRTKQQRVDDAIAAFERATALDPKRAGYFSHLAIALSTKLHAPGPIAAKAALAPKMQRAFAKSVELDPHHLPGLIGLARFYANAPEIAGGSLERAKQFAQRVHALNPLLGELELAYIAERAEDPATALGHYESALKLSPRHPTALAAVTRLRSAN